MFYVAVNRVYVSILSGPLTNEMWLPIWAEARVSLVSLSGEPQGFKGVRFARVSECSQ